MAFAPSSKVLIALKKMNLKVNLMDLTNGPWLPHVSAHVTILSQSLGFAISDLGLGLTQKLLDSRSLTPHLVQPPLHQNCSAHTICTECAIQLASCVR